MVLFLPYQQLGNRNNSSFSHLSTNSADFLSQPILTDSIRAVLDLTHNYRHILAVYCLLLTS